RLSGENLMKSALPLILVAATVISAAVCLARPNFSDPAAPSLQSSVVKTSEASLQQQIVAKERQGLDALNAGNVDLFGDLTAEDAVFVDSQGPASKAQVLKNVAGFRLTEYSMEDVRFVPISPNSGLISYKITEKGISHGKEFAAQV